MRLPYLTHLSHPFISLRLALGVHYDDDDDAGAAAKRVLRIALLWRSYSFEALYK